MDEKEEFSVSDEILYPSMDMEEIQRRLKAGLPVKIAFVVSSIQ